MKNTSLLFLYFNSIKVRLEPFRGDKPMIDEKFQFHKGTIRTASYRSQELISNEFQFHKGTIRTIRAAGFRLLDMYFNSIKVRLELSVLFCVFAIVIFQFHKGTIRTGLLLAILVWFLNFNSIKVRLERSLL